MVFGPFYVIYYRDYGSSRIHFFFFFLIATEVHDYISTITNKYDDLKLYFENL